MESLRGSLVAWERRAFGDALDAYREGVMARYLDGLRGLLEGESRERAVLLAALALGPGHAGHADAADLRPLIRLIVETPVDVVDATIAWGAGWGRTVRPEDGWHARWTGSVLALACMVRSSVDRTVDWLVANVTDFHRVLPCGEHERRERLRGFSEAIAVELATGCCRCGHGVLRAHSRAGSCARQGHRLASWRPHRRPLPAFVAVAVQGSARLPLRADAFGHSMLAGVLEAVDPLAATS